MIVAAIAPARLKWANSVHLLEQLQCVLESRITETPPVALGNIVIRLVASQRMNLITMLLNTSCSD